MTLSIEKELEDTKQSLWNMQQILGYVLLEVGEPVELPKSVIDTPVPENSRITLDEHEDHFTIYLEVPDEAA